MRTSYYLDDYMDECVPCDCTLEGWAAWLAKPDPEWGRHIPARDGETFEISAMDFTYHNVGRENGEWILPDEVSDESDLIAVTWGEGHGWHADMIASDRQNLVEILDDDEITPDEGWVVVGRCHTVDYIGTFRADGPRLEIQPKTVQ